MTRSPTVTPGPADRDWQTLRRIAYRRFSKLGLDKHQADEEAEHFAYSAAAELGRLLEEAAA